MDLNIDIIIFIYLWNYNIFFRLKFVLFLKCCYKIFFDLIFVYVVCVYGKRDFLFYVVLYWFVNELNVEKIINVKYYIRRLDNKGMLLF